MGEVDHRRRLRQAAAQRLDVGERPGPDEPAARVPLSTDNGDRQQVIIAAPVYSHGHRVGSLYEARERQRRVSSGQPVIGARPAVAPEARPISTLKCWLANRANCSWPVRSAF